MDSQVVYSNSLKRMLSFKVFPTINPQRLIISRPPPILAASKIVPQANGQIKIASIKRSLVENSKKERSLEMQVNDIVQKMTEEGAASLTKQRKIGKKDRNPHYRIVSEAEQSEGTKAGRRLSSLNQISWNRKRIRTEVDEARRYLRQKPEQENEIVNVGKYLKHYRNGMSSLKSLNHKRKI